MKRLTAEQLATLEKELPQVPPYDGSPIPLVVRYTAALVEEVRERRAPSADLLEEAENLLGMVDLTHEANDPMRVQALRVVQAAQKERDGCDDAATLGTTPEALIHELKDELRFALEVLSLRQDLDTGEELTWSGNDVDTWHTRSAKLLGYSWDVALQRYVPSADAPADGQANAVASSTSLNGPCTRCGRPVTDEDYEHGPGLCSAPDAK